MRSKSAFAVKKPSCIRCSSSETRLLRQALPESDVDTVERVYSEDYTLTTRKGAVRTREKHIEMLASSQLKYLRIGEPTDVTISVYGHVAVVRGLSASSHTELNGVRRENPRRRFTAVWILEDGSWRQVSRQHTIVEPGVN